MVASRINVECEYKDACSSYREMSNGKCNSCDNNTYVEDVAPKKDYYQNRRATIVQSVTIIVLILFMALLIKLS